MYRIMFPNGTVYPVPFTVELDAYRCLNERCWDTIGATVEYFTS